MNLVETYNQRKIRYIITDQEGNADVQTLNLDDGVSGLLIITIGSPEDPATDRDMANARDFFDENLEHLIKYKKPIIVNHNVKFEYLRID